MDIKISLYPPFVAEINRIREKYGEEMLALSGISKKHLDESLMFDKLIEADTTANASIDPTANIGSKDIDIIMNEVKKPLFKLKSLNRLYKDMTNQYGYETANQWLEMELTGALYMHDGFEASFKSYCYNYSCEPVAKKGMFFDISLKADTPKHLNSFHEHMLEFVRFATKRQSGAVGLGDFLVWSFYFFKKDKDEGFLGITDWEKYKYQNFQNFVYSLNQSGARNGQSAFTNISIFDRIYLYSLFAKVEYPNGKKVIDYVEDIIQYQKDFLNFLKIERAKKLLTFPVLNASLIFKDNKFQDEDMARFCSDHIYLWKDLPITCEEEVTSVSSCCFDENQLTLTKSTKGVNFMTFNELYNAKYSDYKEKFKIFNNGNWVKGKIVKVDRQDKKMYKVTTVNNKELIMTQDHINFTFDGDKETKDLTTDDYLGFNQNELESIKERELNLTYEQGVMIGAYLGDGSKSPNNNTMDFSINSEKYIFLKPTIDKAIKQFGIENTELILGKEVNNVYPCRINDDVIKDFIEFWVKGSYGHEKSLNLECILQSKDFRKGIIDGYYVTDGGNSNRIYSTSKRLIDDIEVLMTSLGIISIVDISDRTDEAVIIRGQEYKRNFPLYCIRFYNHVTNRNMKDIYKKKKNTIFFKIKSIEEIHDYDKQFVYCFEMEDKDDPYFTLPNGIITHNCRLKNDLKTLGLFSSVTGSSLEVGSVKASTINLNRIGLETDYKADDFFELLKKTTIINLKILKVQRDRIQKNIDKGLMILYDLGLMKLKNQYSTVGISAFGDLMEGFGFLKADVLDHQYYTDEGYNFAKKIFDTLNECIKSMNFDFMVNIENVPFESGAITCVKKDKLIFGDKVTQELYSNQWISLGKDASLKEKIKSASILDRYCSGGTMLFINVEGDFNNKEQTWKLLNSIAGQGCITINVVTKLNICANEHNYREKIDICPYCGAPKIDEATKIVGFYTRMSNWQKERKEENRKWHNFSQE